MGFLFAQGCRQGVHKSVVTVNADRERHRFGWQSGSRPFDKADEIIDEGGFQLLFGDRAFLRAERLGGEQAPKEEQDRAQAGPAFDAWSGWRNLL